MKTPAEFSINHPVILSMLLIVLFFFGAFSLQNQNIEFMAPINLPSVIVYTVYPGASAQDVEQDVTKILENNFVTLPNYKSMSSQSTDSLSWITVTYQDDCDPYDQLEEIRYRISTLLDELPESISGQPQALVGGASMLPSIVFSVDAGEDVGRTTDYIENTLRPKINQVPSVAEVQISGGKNLHVNVRLRADDLQSKGIPALQVYQLLQNSNSTLPLGNAIYQGKSIGMRYEGSLDSLEDLKNLTVGADDRGTIVRLEDVADVTLSYPPEKSREEANGRSLILVSVTNRSDGNIVKINTAIKKILEKESKATNGAVKFNMILDYSRTTMASLSTVVRSGISGIIMSMLIIFLFLMDARATLIIGLSVPLSLLFTFLGMQISGISINLMSLSGLVAALGMIVDSSIVMIEEVYRYYIPKTLDVNQSIIRGSREVTMSIIASALTTIVVFFPIAFLNGLVGMILKPIAITLIYALAGSLVVAVVFVPYFMKLFMTPVPKIQKENFVQKGIKWLENKYKKMLSWCISNRGTVIVFSVALLFVTLAVSSSLGMSFLPSTDNNDFYMTLEFPKGYTLSRTTEKARLAEKVLRDTVPEIENLVNSIGNGGGFGAGEAQSNKTNFHIVLVPVSERKRSVQQIIPLVQKAVEDSIPDVSVTMENGGFDKLLGYASGGGGYGLTLVCEDMDKLFADAERIKAELDKDPTVLSSQLDTSFDTDNVTIETVQDYMASQGIASTEAGFTSFILFNGTDCGKLSVNGERYNVHIESDLCGMSMTPDVLSNIQVKSLSGELVDFSNISDFSIKRTLSAINHSERAKTITISAKLISEDTTPVTRHINEYLEKNPLSEGVESKAGGIGELIGGTLPSMLRALVIAFFLVYTVMVIQFERFRQPLIILLGIPFCAIGVVFGLLAFGSTLSLVSLLGIISLGGIVVNNGIILVDYMNQQRALNKEGFSAKSFSRLVSESSATRVRPILMTTLTTMLGVVPMAFAKGEGAELYAPLGQAIAGGLFTSTLITLVLIPVLYYSTELKRMKKNNLLKNDGEENA
ncbi:MAG: efflux RND transporter permease subunit [Treponema sp.]|nr:efflux RND transporter permease subunit [Treponema sp.]